MSSRPSSIDDTPSDLREEYSEEVTQESYREIERLAPWARARGPRFFLIGGWAAWHYHRGLGSRDIDIVLPHQWILERFLEEYYRENGYVADGGPFARSYRKPVQVGDRTEYIEIDAAQIDQGPPFKEDQQVKLPYTLLEDNCGAWTIGKEAVLVPTPELLLLQKVKAYRDRSWELSHRLLSPVESQFLRGKVRKDAYDIGLVGLHVTDWTKVAKLATRYSCKDRIAETLNALNVRESL